MTESLEILTESVTKCQEDVVQDILRTFLREMGGAGGGRAGNVGGISITLTGLSLSAIACIILNSILLVNDYEFGKNPQGDMNRGVSIHPEEEK